MKKILLFMILAAATFMNASAHADHNESFGYFYLANGYGQEVDSDSVVNWEFANSFLDEDESIVIFDESPQNILIKHTGFYRVTWILTLDTDESSGEADIQFGLRFSDGITDFGLVPGSTYGVGNAFGGSPGQLLGQAVILVAHPNSLLELSNESEFNAFLEPFEGSTVFASIRVERLGDLD